MKIESKDANLTTFCDISRLCSDDEAAVGRVAALIKPRLPELADQFYAELAKDAQTAPHIEGRVDALKKTHIAWMEDLLSGNYGDEFIARQEKIGQVHVAVKIPPVFVAASMSFLRSAFPQVISQEVQDTKAATEAISALLRLMDLCQYLIDRAYTQTLMDTLGISPALLSRLMTTK